MSTLKKIGLALKVFFQTIVRSCYDLELYREVRTRRWTKTLAYFALFNLVVAVLTALIAAPSIWSVANDARRAIVDRIPDGAGAVVRSGMLEVSGLPQPFEIREPGFNIVIDTGAAGTTFPEVLEQADAGIFFGRDAIFIRASEGGRQIRPWKEFPDVSIDKAATLAWLDRWMGWIFAAIVLVVFLAWYSGSFVGTALFVIIAAVTAGLIGRLARLTLRFDQWLAVAFHAVTLPTLVDLATTAVDFPIAYAYSVIFALIIVSVAVDEKRRPAVAPPETRS